MGPVTTALIHGSHKHVTRTSRLRLTSRRQELQSFLLSGLLPTVSHLPLSLMTTTPSTSRSALFGGPPWCVICGLCNFKLLTGLFFQTTWPSCSVYRAIFSGRRYFKYFHWSRWLFPALSFRDRSRSPRSGANLSQSCKRVLPLSWVRYLPFESFASHFKVKKFKGLNGTLPQLSRFIAV